MLSPANKQSTGLLLELALQIGITVSLLVVTFHQESTKIGVNYYCMQPSQLVDCLLDTSTGKIIASVYCVYSNRTQAKKIITILTFARFSGKGRQSLH